MSEKEAEAELEEGWSLYEEREGYDPEQEAENARYFAEWLDRNPPPEPEQEAEAELEAEL
jgi:hypothetical protein